MDVVKSTAHPHAENADDLVGVGGREGPSLNPGQG
jgi:hypothetical protein